MATESHEFTGKTVDDATAEGLRALRLRADEAEIEVVNKGSRGIFGLGSEPAVIRIHIRRADPPPPAIEPVVATPPPAPVIAPVSELVSPSEPIQEATAPVAEEKLTNVAPEANATTEAQEEAEESDQEVEQIAVELLGKMIQLLGFDASVQTSWKEGSDELNEHGDRYLLLDVQGADLSVLVGRRGETLENIQYLLRLMVNQQLRKWKNIIVDVEGYKERRVTQLKQLALRTAAQVASTGRAVSLEPMPANERRIIHITLRDHQDIFTESSGEGDRRKVHIVAKS